MDNILGTREDLIKIIQVMSRLNTIRDIDSLLLEILNSAVFLIDAEAGSIILKEKSTGFFTIKAAIGDKAEQFKGIKIPVDKGIVGWTVQNNASLLIEDVAKDDRWYNKSDKETGFSTKSIICVPMAMDEIVFGAIEVLNKRNGGYYDARDEQILTILGALASTTIYNLILFNEVEASRQKIETIINGMADGVMLLNSENQVMVANPAAEAIFNPAYSANLTALELLVSEISQGMANDLLDVVLLKPEAAVLSCKTTFLDKPDGHREGIIVALRNVSKIKEKERRKSEILILIAYQLKDPVLNLIAEQKEKIQSLTDEPLKKREVAILKRMEFISDLIIKLTYYAHIDTGPMRLERKPQKIYPLLSEVVQSLRDFSELTNVSISFVCPEDVRLKFDTETIGETLRNLLIDAVTRSTERSSVELICTDEQEYFQFVICDTGRHYTPDEQANMFSLERQIDNFMDNDMELKDLNLTHAFATYILAAHGGSIEILEKDEKNQTYIKLPKE